MLLVLRNRQKLLLALLREFGGSLTRTDLQKYLFLFCEEVEGETKSFFFVPYRFGAFSFQSYADKRNLAATGYLEDGDDWKLGPAAGDPRELLDPRTRDRLARFRSEAAHLRGDALVAEVYRRYPYYAINSEISGRLLTVAEQRAVEEHRPTRTDTVLFTIGYEGISLEEYLNRLIENDVRLLCDVRKNPLSRKYGFSKSTLRHGLESVGIDYLHLPALGIASSRRRTLNTQADYEALFDDYDRTTLPAHTATLLELAALVRSKERVALTCFERAPCQCHRGRVAAALEKLPGWKHPVEHL